MNTSMQITGLNYWVIIGFITSLFLLITPSANAQISNKQLLKNTRQINLYFQLEQSEAPYQEVVTLANNIIKDRKYYHQDIIAKVFILLTQAASEKGDMARALQFARDGLSLKEINRELKLVLMLKVIAGSYLKGQFKHVEEVTNQAVLLAKELNSTQQLIVALAYRAMAYALSDKGMLAANDLTQVKKLLNSNQEYNEHIQLLEIIAQAHYLLANFDTALTLYNQVLKLRFDLDKKATIDKTYINLAQVYLKKGLFDDAFNTFWEAKNYAQQNDRTIILAHSYLGLGKTLLAQHQYQQSYDYLIEAEQLFQGQNLSQPYLSTLIALAHASNNINNPSMSQKYLLKALPVIETMDITDEQNEFYFLLAKMHSKNSNYQQAYLSLEKYIERFSIDPNHQQVQRETVDKSQPTNLLNRQIALGFAQESELRNSFDKRFNQQQNVIYVLVIVTVLLLSTLIYTLIRLRTNHLKFAYNEQIQSEDKIASPHQTKRLYQLNYKMARRFEYPLAIGYLSITNWKELDFHFDKKVINEVHKTLSLLIKEELSEFELAGQINDGEYLLICPHQSEQVLKEKLDALEKAVKVRFFANLGDFSVKLSFACDSPNIQDIDPYIFLSRLSELTHNKYQKSK